eukprot:m.35835 g.35835  ORF g.35835 m.35835 type:complete len:419 (-) comp12422_c0_seq1:53-1309(-)
MMEVQLDRFSQPLNQTILTPSKPVSTAPSEEAHSATSRSSAKRTAVNRLLHTVDRVALFQTRFQPRLLKLLKDAAADPRLLSPSMTLMQSLPEALSQLSALLEAGTSTSQVRAVLQSHFDALWHELDASANTIKSEPETGSPSAKRANLTPTKLSPGQQRRQLLEAKLSACMQDGAWHTEFLSVATADGLSTMTSSVVNVLLPRVVKLMAEFLIRYRVQAVLDCLASRCDKSSVVAGFAADAETISAHIGKHIVSTDKRTLRQYVSDREHKELESAEHHNHMQRRVAMLATLQAVCCPLEPSPGANPDDDDAIQPVMFQLFQRIEAGVAPELDIPHSDGKVVINRVLLNSGVLGAWNEVVTHCLKVREQRDFIAGVELPSYHASERTLMLATLIHRYFTVRLQHYQKVMKLSKRIRKQ